MIGRRIPQNSRASAAAILTGCGLCLSALLPMTSSKAIASQVPQTNPKDHWSLKPVSPQKPPTSRFDNLALNPIDQFVFAKLQENGLRPNPPADPLQLLRRVTIDLTGLPPTLEEINAFTAGHSQKAYKALVDRLLASTAYGERWGRHWLDVVRFGESNGYEQNHLRPNAWPYRDYVIRAFNKDRPYPQFITEQLAGDVVGKGNPGIEAATGFLVAGIHDTVGIQEEEGTRQQRSNDVDDMVSTTGAAFLGLTVGCAKCHDHKFDPIPQRDYYQLAACFAGVRHGERSVTEAATAPKRKADLDRLSIQEFEASEYINKIESTVRLRYLQSKGLSKATRPAVTSARNIENFPWIRAKYVRFVILATRDGSEPCIDEIQVLDDKNQNVALAARGAKATASSLLPGYAVHQIAHLNDGIFGNEHSWISAEPGTGWVQIELPKPSYISAVVWSRDGGEIKRFDDRVPSKYRIEFSDDAKEWRPVASEEGREGSGNYIHPDELKKAMLPEEATELAKWTAARAKIRAEKERINGLSSIYAGVFTKPDPTYLLRRGDVMQRIEQVQPGALACTGIPSQFAVTENTPEPERRLDLAKWIGDPANPLTARVMVNRIWQHHFGVGIVATSSDLGRNGTLPTHPELLDWLADEFVKSGWSMKHMHRLIVTSATYQQSNRANATGLAKDASNRYLWRMNLQRMEAEAIRDSILQTSGAIDRTMGGPGYPLFTYRVVNVAIYGNRENYGPETFRRSVYQQAARSIHDEVLSAFDCPESSQRAPRREVTTTPLQALNLLNGPFIQQQADMFTKRVQAAGGGTEAQVIKAFQIAFGRSPVKLELTECVSLTKSQGLPALCRVLMNSNEFLTF